jgi:hypothetical protein
MTDMITEVQPSEARPFSIDQEFRDWLPRQTIDEHEALLKSINTYGCLEAVIVWHEENILVDGHHRVAICDDLGLPFNVRRKSFRDRLDVLEFIFGLQGGRRNWSDVVRVQLALKLKPEIEARAKAKQVAAGGSHKKEIQESAFANVGKSAPAPIDTRKEVARIAGVSGEQVRKIEIVLNNAAPEVKQEMIDGTKSVNAAFKAAKKPQRSGESNAIANPQSSEETIVGFSELTRLLTRDTTDAKVMASPHREMYRDDMVNAVAVMRLLCANYEDLFSSKSLPLVLRMLISEFGKATDSHCITCGAVTVREVAE